MAATKEDQELYNELSLYTLEHARSDHSFIHQYAVDAFAAEHADENTRPIKITFALVGLYLFVVKNYSGRQVQLAHIQMAKVKKDWPRFIETERSQPWMGLNEVLKATPGTIRDNAIRDWGRAVWKTWEKRHAAIVRLAESELGIEG